MKNIINITFLVLLFLAASSFPQGIYLGAGIGNTFYGSEITDAVNQAKEISENSTSWKIFAGYHFNDFLGVEGGYRSFGNISSDVEGSAFESKTTCWDVEALGRYQIAIIDIFAKAGVMSWSNDVSYLGQDSQGSATDFMWGIGAGAHFGPFGARLEWESVVVSGPDNLSMVSLSATFGF
jgi:OmpA-OmpF porin, OOP family